MITYKIRIYPNREQHKLIDKMLLDAKEFYNYLLDCHQEIYDIAKMSLSRYDMELFRKEFKCKHLPAQVQQNVCARVDDAFKRFFSKQNKFPRYKSIRQYRSITYPQIGSNCKLLDKKIQFAKLGRVHAVFDRPILGKPKTCTLKKFPSGKYYVFITADNKDIPKLPVPKNRKQVVGIDPGLEKFTMLSDGNYVRRPKFLFRERNRLLRAQRELSRKKKGSKNREKARLKLAKIYEKIADTRRDHHFKVAKWLVSNYDTICIEDLKINFMIDKNKRKSKSLAKLAIDVALYEFLVILHHQAIKYHCTIIDVDPRMTSQTCSECGSTVRKSLDERTHSCPNCGFVCDRDLNAALNILHRGTGGRGTVGSTESIKLVEIDVPGI